MMKDFLAKERIAVLTSLETVLERALKEMPFTGLAEKLKSMLIEYTGRGKTIRGCLVRLGFELCGGAASNQAVRGETTGGGATGSQPPNSQAACSQAGAAMELFQSGLLVHDDIMDRDEFRRGAPTIHMAFARMLKEAGSRDASHNASSLAICAGDLAYFAGFHALGNLDIDPLIKIKINNLAARELALVTIAQCRDVANGAGGSLFAQAEEPGKEEILKLYRYKTGRYTFSMPLAMGAILAGAEEKTVEALKEAGELLGIAFQLKDDELGIFASQEELGKPLGSDIREDKKTLIRHLLMNHPNTQGRIKNSFGNENISQKDLELIKETIKELGIHTENCAIMKESSQRAFEILDEVLKKAGPKARDVFTSLVKYNLERSL